MRLAAEIALSLRFSRGRNANLSAGIQFASCKDMPEHNIAGAMITTNTNTIDLDQ
jgi:hypothetical protein